MTDLHDAIGQPLRVGQAVVNLRDYGSPRAGMVVGLEPFSPLEVGIDDGLSRPLMVSADTVVVIGSSVAEVDARVLPASHFGKRKGGRV